MVWNGIHYNAEGCRKRREKRHEHLGWVTSDTCLKMILLLKYEFIKNCKNPGHTRIRMLTMSNGRLNRVDPLRALNFGYAVGA